MDPSGGRDLGNPLCPPQTSGIPSSSTTPAPSLTIVSMRPDGNSVDEVSQHSTLSMASAASGGDEGPSSSNSENNEDKSTAGGMTEEKGTSFTEIALENYVILKSVFQNLENNDVGSCCQVNECWRLIAHPLYVRHYNVQLEEIQHDQAKKYVSPIRRNRCKFTVHANATYERNEVIYFEETLDGAAEFLLEAAKASKIAISLRSIWGWNDEVQRATTSILTKIGKYVTRFVLGGGNLSLSAICKWLRLMPNLIQLGWVNYRGHFIDDHIDPTDESIRMRSLRVIQLGPMWEGKFVPMVLKMAPNLEEIWSFPVIFVDALVEAGKAFSVKSIAFENPKDDEVKTAFRTMSYLGLKLTEFRLISSPLCDAEYQPSVLRMLESSRDSLETLALHPTRTFDFQALPPMTALKVIDFDPELISESGENGEVKFFAPNTELQRIFPNVVAVKFRNRIRYPYPLNAYVYAEQFASWGRQVQHLKLISMSGNISRSMSLLFPSVQHLECEVRDCNELGVVLREFEEQWPDIESLSVEVGRYGSDSDCTLDSAFTGIQDATLAHLRDPGLRQDHFSSEEIQKFKEGSVLRKLSKLKILKFHLEEYYTLERARKLLGKLCAITAVSKEFGFQFLPDLKIVVRTSDVQFNEVSRALKASLLGTLVRYEVENAESP